MIAGRSSLFPQIHTNPSLLFSPPPPLHSPKELLPEPPRLLHLSSELKRVQVVEPVTHGVGALGHGEFQQVAVAGDVTGVTNDRREKGVCGGSLRGNWDVSEMGGGEREDDQRVSNKESICCLFSDPLGSASPTLTSSCSPPRPPSPTPPQAVS